MCAASVYPEPGSNSLVIFIYSSPWLILFLKFIFFVLVISNCTAWSLKDILFTFQCAFFCFNATYYTMLFFKSQHLFLIFFNLFFTIFYWLFTSFCVLDYNNIIALPCQHFFHSFFMIFLPNFHFFSNYFLFHLLY